MNPSSEPYGRAGLIALALSTLSAFVAVAPATAQQPPDRSYLFPIQITGVEVRVDEAGVASLDVGGVIPNGCSRFEQVVQAREENQIWVQVLARHSGAEICTMIVQLYRDNVVLDGPLPPGAYHVDVNGVGRDFAVGWPASTDP